MIKRARVPVSELFRHVNPMRGTLWDCEQIDVQEVLNATKDREFESRNWDSLKDQLHGTEEGRTFHIRRIALLSQSPIDDGPEHSIQLNIDQQPDGSQIGILNGNHRVAAAFFAEVDMLDVTVYVQDEDDLMDVLPGAFYYESK